ncbi:uncharacterized protein LOC125745549 [Brienomyrus brachyistius]|uniref:uncharacterized protein LOC125745549 n=1 Tax=Brienomyrus brachyistius TaxID=42636 RepID=UPI0020B3B962|nr:uncharacterized protein LOC125745549 [Brienomyrus brachyistius]
MAFIYVLVLLSAALSGVACSWFQRQPSKCRVAWLLATWVASALLWGARLCFHTCANAALSLPSTWDDLEHALVLVVQAWLLLLLHAIPEAHTWLRLASEPCPQTPANVTATGFSEETSLSSWPFLHMHGSCSSHSSSARITDLEAGPSTTFGSNQPTTITILDEEAISVASHSAPHTDTQPCNQETSLHKLTSICGERTSSFRDGQMSADHQESWTIIPLHN